MKRWITDTTPYIVSTVVVFNLVAPKSEQHRRFGTLFHQLRHVTGTWTSRYKSEPTVLLTDSYIDSEARRIAMHACQVCDVCGFCTPTTPDDDPDDERVTPLEYWEFDPQSIIPAIGAPPRQWAEMRKWTYARHSYMPLWTTQSHLNSMNCRQRKI